MCFLIKPGEWATTPLQDIRRCCSGAATRTLLELNENGLLLGVWPSEEYAQTEFTLEAGGRLLIYTDGLVDMRQYTEFAGSPQNLRPCWD
jgi:serine phosphatase RsbU (regulator of sigma subunit)